MSIKLMSKVYDRDIGHPEQAILLAMADHANDDGGDCFPSVARIAWKTGYKPRQVQNIMGRLRDAGALVLVRPASRHRAAEYSIVLDALPEKAPFMDSRGAKIAPLPVPINDSRDAKASAPLPDLGVQSLTLGVQSEPPRGAKASAPEPSLTTIQPLTHGETVPESDSGSHATACASPLVFERIAPPSRKWDPFFKHVGERMGLNPFLVRDPHTPAAWARELSVQFGKPSGNDPLAAIALFDRFEEWAKRTRWAGCTRWDYCTASRVKEHAAKFLTSPAAKPTSAKQRYGRVITAEEQAAAELRGELVF